MTIAIYEAVKEKTRASMSIRIVGLIARAIWTSGLAEQKLYSSYLFFCRRMVCKGKKYAANSLIIIHGFFIILWG